MARCVGHNTFEIVPYECPPLKNITCTNGKTPVLMYDDYHCCQHYECDCECEGWSDSNYITFDGLYYSYQGNCSYYLMKEITPMHDLEIYIDKGHCDPTEDVSCSQSLIVKYGAQSIKLVNGKPDFKAFKNEVSLKLPYWEGGVKVMSSGNNLVLEILRLEVVVKFGRTSFSINLPYKYFGGNTEGHCGTCSNNQMDDGRLPGGTVVKNCAVMADYWLVKEESEKPGCKKPKEWPSNEKEPPLEQTPCNSSSICELLKSRVFADCHQWISPDNFYKGCVFDSCHVDNRAVECNSLEMYAAACSEIGLCIHWRNHTELCASDCPSDKIYSPCGPADQPTCEDSSYDPVMNFTTEGCFCPKGMKLFSRQSKICVKSCGCLDPDGMPRELNETFEYKCQNCVCEESTKTVTCKPKTCQAPDNQTCTKPGYVLVSQTDQSDPCCTVNVCKPKEVCVLDNVEYQPGSSVPGQKCENCYCSTNRSSDGLMEIRCETQHCEKTCKKGFEYVKINSGDCCGTCVQTHCVISVNGTEILLKEGETQSSPENKCENNTCVKSGETFTVISSHIVCPPFIESNCKNDTIQTAANGCCKICLDKEKGCKLVNQKTHINHNNCQSEVDMPYCEGSCNTFTKYSEAAAAMEHSCSCCKETRTSNRTVDLKCKDENSKPVSFTYVYVEECGCGHTECTTPVEQHVRRRRRFTLQ